MDDPSQVIATSDRSSWARALYAELERRGVSVRHPAEPCGDAERLTADRHQLYLAWNPAREAVPELRELAQKIVTTAAPAVTIYVYPLWVPPDGKGVIDAERLSWRDLNIRRLVAYEPSSDETVIRIDILFSTNA